MTVTDAQPSRATHRATLQPKALKRVGRRLTSAVIGVALAAAAVYAQTFALPFEQRTSLLTTTGRAGEVVSTSRYSVKVTSVVAALAVDTQDFSGQVTKVATSNLFLVVGLSATATREPLQLSPFSPPVLLTEDGRRYRATDKVDQSLTAFDKRYQPGFWSSGVLVFEVPKDAVPCARLVVAPAGPAIVDYSTPEAEIDLGLSEAAATRLISEAEEYHSLVSRTT